MSLWWSVPIQNTRFFWQRKGSHICYSWSHPLRRNPSCLCSFEQRRSNRFLSGSSGDTSHQFYLLRSLTQLSLNHLLLGTQLESPTPIKILQIIFVQVVHLAFYYLCTHHLAKYGIHKRGLPASKGVSKRSHSPFEFYLLHHRAALFQKFLHSPPRGAIGQTSDQIFQALAQALALHIHSYESYWSQETQVFLTRVIRSFTGWC